MKFLTLKSLKTKVLLWILLILVPILIILSVNAGRIFSSYSRQMEQNAAESLHRYSADIDSALMSGQRSLYNIDISDILLHLEEPGTLEYLQAIENIGDVFSSSLALEEYLDAYFLLWDDQILFSGNYHTLYSDNRHVADDIRRQVINEEESSEKLQPNRYQMIRSGSSNYLILYYETADYILGCWFSCNNLVSSLKNAQLPAVESVYFSSLDAEISTVQGYTLTNASLSAAPYHLTVLWNNRILYQALYQTQNMLIMVSISAVVLLVIYILLMQHSLFRPMAQLIKDIDHQSREPACQLTVPVNESTEFQRVYEALISMTGEIRSLKIDMYEQKIARQKTQLELYQLQLRPHFFLNVLNNIQCMIQSGNICEAADITDLLTKYCRYVLYNSQFVILDEELNFVKNYIQLQNIQRNCTYMLHIACAEELLDLEIPILILQIPIENTIKHAVTDQEYLKITIQGEELFPESDDRHCLHLRISDNGQGFSVDVLDKLQSGESPTDMREGHGIGLINIRKRLELYYGGRASLSFSNAPEGGSVVDIMIPIS